VGDTRRRLIDEADYSPEIKEIRSDRSAIASGRKDLTRHAGGACDERLPGCDQDMERD
jgi:hypothetical protein